MAEIEYLETDQQSLSLIEPLWQKLIEHHKMSSKLFYEQYSEMTFNPRVKQLLEKSKDGAMRIDLAMDTNTRKLVGYCVSTISKKGQGEVDTMYVEPDYRRSGVADNLMKRALRWMDELSVAKKILEVGGGNEEVITFYNRYDFYPRNTILEQVEAKETGK